MSNRQLAALYGRESKGLDQSIEEQHEEEREVCAEHDWDVFRVYEDRISASNFARKKKRDDWDELLADMEARRFDILVLWEPSRGDRKAKTWMGMLELAGEAGILIYVVSDERLYDVRNVSDWRELAHAGVDSESESRKSSKRLRRHIAIAARNGHVHGHVVYGYERRYDPVTKKFVEQSPHPRHSLVARFIIRQIAKQVSISMIRKRLHHYRILSPSGMEWWPRNTIRKIATNPAYIGMRSHKGTLYKACWPAIVDEETFWAAQRVLTAPDRQKYRPGRTHYLLSYLIVCDVCNGGVQARRRPDRPHGYCYICQQRGCVSATPADLEEFIVGLVLRRVREPDIYQALSARSDAEIVAARAEVERLRSELEEFYDQAAAGRLSAEALARVEAKKLPVIRAAEERAANLGIPPALRPLLDPTADVRERWEGMALSAQREVIRLLFEPIRLRRYGRRGRYVPFDPNRVVVTWRTQLKAA